MSYRDVLARTERKRADGTPVWPLRDSDRSGLLVAAADRHLPPAARRRS